MPEITATFRCAKCQTTQQVAVARGKLIADKAPGNAQAAVVRCPRCGYLQKVPVRPK